MGSLLNTFLDMQDALGRMIQEVTVSLRTAADRKMWLNIALRILAERTKYFEASGTLTTVASTKSYDLDANLTRWIDLLGVKEITYNGVALDVADPEALAVKRNATTEGVPSEYTIWNKNIELFVIPDAAKTLKVWHWQYPAEMTADANTSGLPLHHNLILIYGAMWRAYELDEHPLADRYRKLFEGGVAELAALVESSRPGPELYGVRLDADTRSSLPNVG